MRDHIRHLFDAAIIAADPAAAVERFSHMITPPGHGGKLVVIAIGKAASPMLKRAVAHIPNGTDWHGLLVTNEGNEITLPNCKTIIGGHPIPSQGSHEAGKAILDLLRPLGANDRVLALISGGGSALVVAPQTGISLDDKIALNQSLLANGFDINQTNEIRQMISQIKGGGITQAANPAPVTALILSDVIGDDLRAIASGPTAQPIGTPQSATQLLHGKGVFDALPETIKSALNNTATAPTAIQANNTLIGSNTQSVDAVISAAKGDLTRLATPIIGDVKDAAQSLIQHTQHSFVGGGETTVTLTGKGKGGRNQELALRFALAAQNLPDGWLFLSGGTDGRDGPTDAAGAIVDSGTLQRIADAGLDIDAILQNNDAYRALEASGDLIIMPATGTNVADIQIFLKP